MLRGSCRYLIALVGLVASATAADAWTLDLDFVGNTVAGGPHDAFHGEMDVSDANILNGRFGSGGSSVRTGFLNESSAEATQSQYDALQLSDDIWLQTADPGFGDNAFVRFEFSSGLSAVDLAGVLSVSFSVEARQGDPYTDDWHIYLWDYAQGAYMRLSLWQDKAPDELQSQTLVAGYVSTNGLLLAAARDLIDPATGRLTGLVVNQDTSDWIRVDTASLSIEIVPEPATALLVAIGLFGLGRTARGRGASRGAR